VKITGKNLIVFGVAVHRYGALAACRNGFRGRPAEKPPEHRPEFYEPRHSSPASPAIPKPLRRVFCLHSSFGLRWHSFLQDSFFIAAG
jgi:hypothetical protein